MDGTLSKKYVAALTGSAGLVGALFGIYLDLAWYLELPIAIAAGLLVGFGVATLVKRS